MTEEDVLKELYRPSVMNNCIEYQEGLIKHPPDGYGDSSLKEYWEHAIQILKNYKGN